MLVESLSVEPSFMIIPSSLFSTPCSQAASYVMKTLRKILYFNELLVTTSMQQRVGKKRVHE